MIYRRKSCLSIRLLEWERIKRKWIHESTQHFPVFFLNHRSGTSLLDEISFLWDDMLLQLQTGSIPYVLE